MCKLDDILKTEIRKHSIGEPAEKGISFERVEFNTDVIFAVAKKMELPLDKTADLMRRKGQFDALRRAYSQRHRMSIGSISNTISKSLKEE
mgnify:CR=1 FL=1